MNSTIRKIFPILFLLCLQNIHALDIEITGKEAALYSKMEYNRSFLGYGNISTTGAIELNNICSFRGGFLLGTTKYYTDIRFFTDAALAPWAKIPLRFSLAYIYNGLPQYKAHAHTILPVVSYNGKWAGIGAGVAFRFTSFFRETALFESILSFSGYVNFVNNEKLRIGICCANFNDFYAGNMGAYSLSLYSAVHINKQWSIINDIELLQSGSVGLSANFYGINWRGGVKFTW